MNDVEMLNKSYELIRINYGNTKDKSGVYKILHPLSVYGNLEDSSVEVQVVGLLHDLLEDYPQHTPGTLFMTGFSPFVVDTVDILTRKPEDTYKQYIKKIKLNHSATVVKLEDLTHNLCRIHTGIPDKERISLMNRWSDALSYLMEGFER